MSSRRILIISTPVGPLGSGVGGGVELTLHSLVLGLTERGHHVEVLAPVGSLHVGAVTRQIPGALQPTAHTAERDTLVTVPADSVLAAMCEWARVHQGDFDVVLNLAYDWLPFYLTPFFVDTPLAHLVSMASVSDVMDDVIERAAALHPQSVAMHSQAQAATFPSLAGHVAIVGNGIAVERYDLHIEADTPPHLGFVGRISAEKGLSDAVAVAEATGLPLKIWGLMQDQTVWDVALAAHPMATVSYEGFLPTDELQAAIGGCAAVIMAPKWVEAFGNVAIEAMATGVPVIAYRRGGPAEIIVDGETGFLVEPDDVAGLVAAVQRIDELDRVECRQRVEEEYSVAAFTGRVEQWLEAAIECHRNSWSSDQA